MTKKEMLREFGRDHNFKNKNVAVAFVVESLTNCHYSDWLYSYHTFIRHISASLRQNGYVFGA